MVFLLVQFTNISICANKCRPDFCVLNSNIACPTGNPATSNMITMVENTVNPVSIVISTPVTTVCNETSVTFTATPSNGGTNPGYHWFINGLGVPQYAPTMSYASCQWRCITCILTSNLVCTRRKPGNFQFHLYDRQSESAGQRWYSCKPARSGLCGNNGRFHGYRNPSRK